MNRHSQNTHDDSTAFNIYRKTCLNAILTVFHSGNGFVLGFGMSAVLSAVFNTRVVCIRFRVQKHDYAH